MPHYFRFIICLILLGTSLACAAQVSILPLPSRSEAFLLEDIWRVSLINGTSGALSGDLVLSIQDDARNLVFSATVSGLRIESGANNINRNNLREATIQYGSGLKSATLRRTGVLPYGEYILCYSYSDIKSAATLGEYCYEKTVQPLLPPELIQPYDGENLQSDLPLLVWKGPFPTGDLPVTFALRLVEVDKGLSAQTAIERNKPLLSRQYKGTTQLLYPKDALALEPGKVYAWQVAAFSGDFNLGTTEAWTFSVEPPVKLPEDPESYRMVTETPNGVHYLAKKGVLRFAYDNRDGATELDYEVLSLSTSDKNNIKLATKVTLHPGINKVDMDLSAEGRLEDRQKYLLTIHRPNGNNQYFEFIYRKHE